MATPRKTKKPGSNEQDGKVFVGCQLPKSVHARLDKFVEAATPSTTRAAAIRAAIEYLLDAKGY